MEEARNHGITLRFSSKVQLENAWYKSIRVFCCETFAFDRFFQNKTSEGFLAQLAELTVIGHKRSVSLCVYVLSRVAQLTTGMKQDAQLSQRDRAAGCVIVFAKSRRLELGDNILRTV